MIGVEGLQRLIPNLERQSALGTPARLTLFFWSLAMVLLMPIARLPLAGGLVLLVTAVLYPTALRRLFRWRWLIFALLLLLPPLLWSGTAGAGLAGQESFFPWAGLVIGLQMVLRMVVVVVAVDGLSGAVDVAEVAGLLERCGLRGWDLPWAWPLICCRSCVDPFRPPGTACACAAACVPNGGAGCNCSW
jgi:hypothetical protein